MGLPPPAGLEWQLFEAQFAAAGYNGRPGPALLVQEHPGPLHLTAVHSINHWRDSTDKPADMFTGALAWLLAMRLPCTCAINSHRHPAINSQQGVPPIEHWLLERAAAQPAKASPLIVLDLHGAVEAAPFDVALGTAGTPTPGQQRILKALTAHLAGAGFQVALNPEGYAAMSPRALIWRLRHQHEVALDGVQIEISRRWRDPVTQLAAANSFFQAFETSLQNLLSSGSPLRR